MAGLEQGGMWGTPKKTVPPPLATPPGAAFTPGTSSAATTTTAAPGNTYNYAYNYGQPGPAAEAAAPASPAQTHTASGQPLPPAASTPAPAASPAAEPSPATNIVMPGIDPSLMALIAQAGRGGGGTALPQGTDVGFKAQGAAGPIAPGLGGGYGGGAASLMRAARARLY